MELQQASPSVETIGSDDEFGRDVWETDDLIDGIVAMETDMAEDITTEDITEDTADDTTEDMDEDTEITDDMDTVVDGDTTDMIVTIRNN